MFFSFTICRVERIEPLTSILIILQALHPLTCPHFDNLYILLALLSLFLMIIKMSFFKDFGDIFYKKVNFLCSEWCHVSYQFAMIEFKDKYSFQTLISSL